ncbi:MAG: acyl carrier protein [Acidimicrobiaceae bacterium]|nr:acyl carrier protein [Acidimicrobiaceae bacterium]
MPGPTRSGAALEGTPEADPTAVLAEVRSTLTDIIGEDYVEDIDIGMSTSFRDDLDLESIEFVALGEALANRYGQHVDFAGWIASMDVDEIIGLTVGNLVEHIVGSYG